MRSLLKTFFTGALFSALIVLLSCGQTNRNINNETTPNDFAVEEEIKKVSNEDYQAELQQNILGLRQMDDRNQELKKKQENQRREEERLAEELRKEEEIIRVKEWLIGTWEWSGFIWGNRVWTRLSISDDYIVLSSSDGILDKGSYRIDLEKSKIHFGNYSYAKIDIQNRKIYADEGEPYYKVSQSPSF